MRACRLAFALFLLALCTACSNDVKEPSIGFPAKVTDLRTVAFAPTSIALAWTAPGRIGTDGTATTYDVRYSLAPITESNFSTADQATGEPAPHAAGTAETFSVTGLLSGSLYHFALIACNEVPNCSDISNVVSARTTPVVDTTPPAAVSDLAAGVPTAHSVALSWTAPGDDGSQGTASAYDVRYSLEGITDANFAAATAATGAPIPDVAGTPELFIVSGLQPATTYFFALRTRDESSNVSGLSNVVSRATTPEVGGWGPLGAGMDNEVHVLALYNGDLIAGGSFTIAGGAEVGHIARWDGSAWHGLDAGTDGPVLALAVYDGELIAGGSFNTAGRASAANIARWNGSTWSALDAGANGLVLALAVQNNDLIVGGHFTNAGGVAASNVARWDGASWDSLAAGLDQQVETLVVYHAELFAGGRFGASGSLPEQNIARWDGVVWTPLGPSPDAPVYTLAVFGDDLIVGGDFTAIGQLPVSHIASWNGAAWSALGAGAGNGVFGLTVYNDALIASGFFETAGEVAADFVARWDGSAWWPLGLGTDDAISAVVPYGGDLVAGGIFLNAGGAPANRIALWHR
jgi:hypothetical protein